MRHAYHLGPRLPVELLSFTATKNKSSINLNWKTENETNLSPFVADSSTNMFNWKEAGTVRAFGGGAHEYAVTDRAPAKGKNYYRLKINNNNGSISYTRVTTGGGVPYRA